MASIKTLSIVLMLAKFFKIKYIYSRFFKLEYTYIILLNKLYFKSV